MARESQAALQQQSQTLAVQIEAARAHPLETQERRQRRFWDLGRGGLTSFGTSGVPPAGISTGFDVLTFLTASYQIPVKLHDVIRDRRPIHPPKPNVIERFWMSMQNVVLDGEKMAGVVDDWQLHEKVRLQKRLLRDIKDQERARLSMIQLTSATAIVRGALLALSEVPHTADGLAGLGQELSMVIHTQFAALGEATAQVAHDPHLALIPALVVGAVGTVSALNFIIGVNATYAAQRRIDLLHDQVEEYKARFDDTKLNIFEKGAHELGVAFRPVGKLVDAAVGFVAPAIHRRLNRFT